MVETRKCFKCGTEKVAILNAGDERKEVQMVKMAYGANRGRFRCKDKKACAKVAKKK